MLRVQIPRLLHPTRSKMEYTHRRANEEVQQQEISPPDTQQSERRRKDTSAILQFNDNQCPYVCDQLLV